MTRRTERWDRYGLGGPGPEVRWKGAEPPRKQRPHLPGDTTVSRPHEEPRKPESPRRKREEERRPKPPEPPTTCTSPSCPGFPDAPVVEGRACCAACLARLEARAAEHRRQVS